MVGVKGVVGVKVWDSGVGMVRVKGWGAGGLGVVEI